MVTPHTRKERSRCIAIVLAYRDELVEAYRAKPHAKNAMQVLRVIGRLDDMIREIEEIPREKAKAEIHVGGFSMDEMARAEEIMAQQDRNPFED